LLIAQLSKIIAGNVRGSKLQYSVHTYQCQEPFLVQGEAVGRESGKKGSQPPRG
jgi:hypothetical protein